MKARRCEKVYRVCLPENSGHQQVLMAPNVPGFREPWSKTETGLRCTGLHTEWDQEEGNYKVTATFTAVDPLPSEERP